MDTHLRVLSGGFQINTNMIRFHDKVSIQIFALLCLDESSLSIRNVYGAI